MGGTILICEDRDALRELYRAVLAEGEYSVLEARDGRESLELARQARPDLVVLDLVMPGMSGLDVLEKIRTDAALAGVKVVLCTASRVVDQDVVAQLGADRVLVKPFPTEELRAAVDELLSETT